MKTGLIKEHFLHQSNNTIKLSAENKMISTFRKLNSTNMTRNLCKYFSCISTNDVFLFLFHIFQEAKLPLMTPQSLLSNMSVNSGSLYYHQGDLSFFNVSADFLCFTFSSVLTQLKYFITSSQSVENLISIFPCPAFDYHCVLTYQNPLFTVWKNPWMDLLT